jgi:uncharacterized protein with PQ loop repeat
MFMRFQKMDILPFTIIGYVGGVLLSVMNLPLLRDSFRDKPVFPPISFLVLNICVSCCYLIYGVGIAFSVDIQTAAPSLIPNTICILMIAVVIYRYNVYR